MKTKIKKQLRYLALESLIVIVMLILVSCGPSYSNNDKELLVKKAAVNPPAPDGRQKIMLALLLDTSNSMDGLIEQAKSQLWTIVNELASARCSDGNKPEVRIALYEYGNDGLPASEGYIRMVTNLTNDLDKISSDLFQLTTNGGQEYCGQVIKSSLAQLDWSESQADVKMIFIAGNEPFTQGEIPYKLACGLAKEKDIVVNTIFCGPHEEGISTSWKNGADLTQGSYMSIEQDRKTVYIKTPYDDKIDQLNREINSTYVYYGKSGRVKKEMQSQQDSNAASYGQGNSVQRALSKSSHVYKNESWDLVDATEENEKAVEEVEEEYLPEEMKNMDMQERKEYVADQKSKRDDIKKEIMELNKKRTQYITENHQKEDKEGMLDAAMVESVRSVARSKNMKFD